MIDKLEENVVYFTRLFPLMIDVESNRILYEQKKFYVQNLDEQSILVLVEFLQQGKIQTMNLPIAYFNMKTIVKLSEEEQLAWRLEHNV